MKNKIIYCGIYEILNKENNKRYIGSSNDIEKRWKEHKRMLQKGSHHSIKLQRAWDKYGEESFEFNIVEECEPDRRLYLEQYYIDKHKVFFEGYNCKEKTRDMYSEIDYYKEKEYSTCSNIILNAHESFMDFSDKKTIKRAENYNYKNNEHIWYVDVILFVKNILKEYDYLYIQNNQLEDKGGFIDFDIKSGYLPFVVIIKKYNSKFNFKYCLSKRSIIFTTSEILQGKKKTIFDEIVDYNNEKCEYLLGKIFYFYQSEDGKGIGARYNENSKEYFDIFTKSINMFNLKEMYDKYFSESNPIFLKNMYKYFEDYNIELGRIVGGDCKMFENINKMTNKS